MANLTQFYRGEKVPITMTPAAGETISGLGMYVYLDDLDLTNSANADKVVSVPSPTQSGSSYIFTIPAATTKDMKAGSYTVELYYGTTTIVRANRAFTLVDSGYALKNPSNSNNASQGGNDE